MESENTDARELRDELRATREALQAAHNEIRQLRDELARWKPAVLHGTPELVSPKDSCL